MSAAACARRLACAAPAALIAALALAGCGGSSSSSKTSGGSIPSGGSIRAPTATSVPSGGPDAVTIGNYAYGPAKLTVKAGARVTFSNHDSTAHTATADDQSFDTGALNPGQSRAITPSRPGTYPYHCLFHPFMHGQLVVVR
jgi:plastocyanin